MHGAKVLSSLFLALAVGAACGDDPAAGTTADAGAGDVAADAGPLTTVWVDEAAAAGGDGSEAAPFQRLEEALATDAETILVRAGTYQVPGPWTVAAPLTLAGDGEARPTLQTGAAPWALEAALTVRQVALVAPLIVQGAAALTLEDVRASGALTLDGLPAATLDDVELTGGAGLTTLAVAAVALTNLRVDGAEGDAVTVQGGEVTWTGGEIVAPGDRGLVADGADAVVSGVTFAQGGQRGLLTVQGAATVAAEDVTLTGGGMGLFLSEGAATVTRGHFEGFGTSGVLTSAGTDLVVTGSTFKDNPGGHVAQVGAGATLRLEDSELDGAQEICVSAGTTEGAIRITGNTIRNCRGSAISLSQGTDMVVSGNTLEEVRPDPIFQEVADGISVVDATATLSGNTIRQVDMRGIGVIRSFVTVTDNIIGPCGDAGVNILDPGPEPVVIQGNTITKTVGAGVALLQAPGVITGNTISAVYLDYTVGLGDGIVFAQADATVEGNVCELNARAGVAFFEGASGVIGGNELRDNAGYGIAEFCTTGDNAVTIRADNVISGNAVAPMSLCSATVEP